MKKFLVIGNANAITYKEVFPYFIDGTMHCRTNTGKCTYIFWFITKDGEKKLIPSLWYTNINISNPKQKLVLTKTYAPDKYPKYDNYDAIEVGCVKNIPKDYDGVMGVPMSILLFDLNDIEIVGMTENADYLKSLYIDGYDKYDRGYVNGKRMYSRVLIKKR